jgi:ribonuclease HII
MIMGLIQIGVDEVGRGCLAGPVAACAYVFNEGIDSLPGLKDSKKMTARAREKMEPVLIQAGRYGYGEASQQEVDEIGIDPANFLAMRRAIENLGFDDLSNFVIIVDGNKHPPFSDMGAGDIQCVVKADDIFPCVSAASVIAKVRRDRLMTEMSVQYPGYEFESNFGYGSSKHLAAIEEIGPCCIHRMSFAPMSKKKNKSSVSMRP